MTGHALPSNLRGGTLPTESWKLPNGSVCRREQGVLRSYLWATGNLRLHWGGWGRDTGPISIRSENLRVCLWPSRCSLTLESLVAPNQTSAYAGPASPGARAGRAQGEAGQLVPNEQREETREGPLTEEVSWAEAAVSWPRALLPPTSIFWLTLYLTTAQLQRPTDRAHLVWLF